MSNQQEKQEQLLDLIEQALTQPPAQRDAWLRDNSDPDSLAAARRLLDLAQSATADVWQGLPTGTAPVSLVGRQIGAFVVERLLGEGGMGQVYLAKRNDGEFEQSVAIKVVRSQGLHSALAQQFDIERQILANLRHPNIASLLDGGTTDDGLHYVVMEYIDGVPLAQYLDDASPDVEGTLRLFVKLCRAVESAHQALIIHRDIKPGNILVDRQGEPRLLDFGIAKVLASGGQTDSKNTILGALTPTYASPEQIRGAPLTTATDVYSLGVVLYEALTGGRPHDIEGLSPGETERVLTQTMTQPPSQRIKRNATRSTALRGDVDAIVLKALAAETSRRYGAAGALADDIERYLRSEPVTAQRDSGVYRLRKLISRNRLATGALALTTVAIVSALGVSLWQAGVANEQRTLAVKQLERAEAVSDFLGDILLSPSANWDADIQTGTNATISDILDVAEAKMEDDLAAQPEVQIELLSRIAEARIWMEQLERSEAVAKRALQIAMDKLPADSPVRVDLFYRMGTVNYELGRHAEAIGFYERAMDASRAQGTQGNLRWLYILNDKAMAHVDTGEFQLAFDMQQEALDGLHALFGDEVLPSWSIGYGNLGFYQFLLGDLGNAMTSFQKGLVAYEAFPEQTRALGLILMNHIGVLHFMDGDVAAAAQWHTKSIAVSGPLIEQGTSIDDYGIGGSRLAMRECDMGNFAAADEQIEFVSTLHIGFLDSPYAWLLYQAQAWCFNARGEFEQALLAAQKAQELGAGDRVHASGEAHREQSLAIALAGLGRMAEAQEAKRVSLTAYEDWLGPAHPYTQRVRKKLSSLIP